MISDPCVILLPSMRYLPALNLLLLLAVPGCSQDYTVTDSFTQTVETRKASVVELQCHCPEGVEVVRHTSSKIKLKISGELSSLGYQGQQDKPDGIEKELLSFRAEYHKDTLKLISQEWTYLHHAFMITDLKIYLPTDLPYQFRKIKGSALEGR